MTPGVGGSFVGRRAEQDAFERALGEPASGIGTFVISGEPGIGKTRLLAELAAIAGGKGRQVVADPLSRWRCSPPDATAARGAGDPSGPVLLLDDAHRADPDCIDRLVRLLRHPTPAGELVVIAFRRRQAPVRLLAAVAEGVRHGTAWQTELPPLSWDQTVELIGPRGTPAWRRAIFTDSGGNPCYLGILTCPAPPGQLAVAAPEPAADAMLAELDAASPAARLVAQAAAVVGNPSEPSVVDDPPAPSLVGGPFEASVVGRAFEASVVAEVAEVSQRAVLSALDELAGLDIIRFTGPGPRFEFRHRLLGQVTYRSASPGWRAAAHDRAAAALARRGQPVEARADHVAKAAQTGDLDAVSVLAEAAQSMRVRAPAAAGWLRAALRLLPDDREDTFRRADLMVRLASALGESGRLRESRDVLHGVLPLLAEAPAGRRIPALVRCAAMDRRLGHWVEARAILLGQLQAVADLHPPDATALLLELAAAELTGGNVAAARDRADRGLALAREACSGTKNAALLTTALGWLAVASVLTGDVAEADRCLTEAALLVDAALDGELADHSDAVAWVASGEAHLERFPDALRHLGRTVPRARNDGCRARLLVEQAWALRWTGRLLDAEAACKDAIESALASESPETRTEAFAVCCSVDTWIGDLAAAVRNGRAAVESPGGVNPWCVARASGALAEALLAAGDLDGCTAQVDGAGGQELPRADPWSRGVWCEMLTRAELARGRMDRAADWAERAVTGARRLGLAGSRGLGHLAMGHLRAARDPSAALGHGRAAAALFSSAGMALEMGRARLLTGSALVTVGEGDRAIVELSSAQTIFESRGARRLARQAVQERRRLAGHARRRPSANGLTGREQQVANLAADGLTNRKIAQRLYITEKTVEVHLSRAYAKLGVSTRAALATAIVRALSRQSFERI